MSKTAIIALCASSLAWGFFSFQLGYSAAQRTTSFDERWGSWSTRSVPGTMPLPARSMVA